MKLKLVLANLTNRFYLDVLISALSIMTLVIANVLSFSGYYSINNVLHPDGVKIKLVEVFKRTDGNDVDQLNVTVNEPDGSNGTLTMWMDKATKIKFESLQTFTWRFMLIFSSFVMGANLARGVASSIQVVKRMKYELLTIRALGAKNLWLFTFLLWQNLISFVISSIAGVLMSVALLPLFIQAFSLWEFFTLTVPLDIILFLIAVTFLLNVLSTFIGFLRLKRIPLSEVTRLGSSE